MTNAGIVLKTLDGQALFLQDHDGVWWLGAGGKGEVGETPLETAVRECKEETGLNVKSVQFFAQTPEYTAFICRLKKPVEVHISDEHKQAIWAPVDAAPSPLHPGCLPFLTRDVMTELDIATAIREGVFTSPQPLGQGGSFLFDMRISGTRLSYRHRYKEFTWRDPAMWTSAEMIARCNGLPVIWEHPKTEVMTTEDVETRLVGTIIMPYVKGEELWGIARIMDERAADLLREDQYSTSPGVSYSSETGEGERLELKDGKTLVFEVSPTLMDHLAICELGVWDKQQGPHGIVSEEVNMAKRYDDAKTLTDPEELCTKVPTETRVDRKSKHDEDDKSRHDEDDKYSHHDDEDDKSRHDEDDKFCHDDDNEAMKEHLREEGEELTKIESKPKRKVKARTDDDEDDKSSHHDDEDDKSRHDEDDKHHRNDASVISELAALKRELAALRKATTRVELSEDELAARDAARHRADSVMNELGKPTVRPLEGESALSYRRRVVSQLQHHSKKFASANLKNVNDSAVFDHIEEQVYADAREAARTITDSLGSDDGIRLVEENRGGQVWRRYHGSPISWVRPENCIQYAKIDPYAHSRNRGF